MQSDRTPTSLTLCLPLSSSSTDSECTRPLSSMTMSARAARPPLLSIPNYLKLGWSARSSSSSSSSSTASIHRCLLVFDILSLILDFIRTFDSECESEHWWRRTSGKRTLASLARTCRALSAPALDVLWMRLDSLDPLIKVLPRRMWAKKHYPIVVRMFMADKHWSTFRKYAVRVRFLRGPCWRMPGAVQHNVIAALARHPKASLPLLPNLTELVWSELKMSNLIDPSVSLIKYFASPGVTSLSLFLICWPNHVSSELAVLADLPNLCPNITAFTAFFPRSSYNDHSHEIGEIVTRWPRLRVLRSCALSQPVMDTVMSRRTTLLDTLSVELNNSSTAHYVGHLPPHVHTWSLGGNSAALCLGYLAAMHGSSPTDFHLRVGADDSTAGDVEALLAVLPARLDASRLRTLTIELTSSYWSTPASDTFVLTPALLGSLGAFASLTSLDVSAFCAADVDDDGYARWASGMTCLETLKVGVADVTRARPVATVAAVVAVLRACKRLETLWIVFDGSFCPSPPGRGKTVRGSRSGSESEEAIESENEWGVTNLRITQIRVGHSPIAEGEDVGQIEKELAALAACLRAVMPRLQRIRGERYPLELNARWRRVEEMVVEGRREEGEWRGV